MGMQEALVARLAGAAPIAAIVGTRISAFARQRQLGLPALTLSKISPGREWTHSGPDELDQPRVQFDCWAETGAQALALAAAVQAEMEQVREVAGWRFHEGFLQAEGWLSEGEQDGGAPLFRVSIDFLFFTEEI